MLRHSPPPLLALYVLRCVGVRNGPGGHMGRGLAPADDDEQQRDGREDEHEGREVHEHHSFRGLVSTVGAVDTARAKLLRRYECDGRDSSGAFVSCTALRSAESGVCAESGGSSSQVVSKKPIRSRSRSSSSTVRCSLMLVGLPSSRSILSAAMAWVVARLRA